MAQTLAALDLKETIWVSLVRGDEMNALLAIEFTNFNNCLITHAYLRNNEINPFDWDVTQEQWYKAREDLIIIQDDWGEFIPLKITNNSPAQLETKLGNQIILLEEVSQENWTLIQNEFNLTGQ